MGILEYIRPARPAISETQTDRSSVTALKRNRPSWLSKKSSSQTLFGSSEKIKTLDAEPLPGPQHSEVQPDREAEALIDYLHQQQCALKWFNHDSNVDEGVILRLPDGGSVKTRPTSLNTSSFASVLAASDSQCAVTVNSETTRSLVEQYRGIGYVALLNGMKIQILSSVSELPSVLGLGNAVLIATSGLLLVWDDEPANILARVTSLKAELKKLRWRSRSDGESGSVTDQSLEKPSPVDEECGKIESSKRPINLQNAIQATLTLIVMLAAFGAAWRQLAIEVATDDFYDRLALLVIVPIQIILMMYFVQIIVTYLAQFVGPVSQTTRNSKFFSAYPMPRLQSSTLPHVTVQCPVYKEDLATVIIPTVRSIRAAIATYESQGGSVNVFINDDGLRLIPEEERQARLDFYNGESVGWVARPRHGEDGFQRKGRFQKASNMNFALQISCKVEEELQKLPRTSAWNQADEELAYGEALGRVIDQDRRVWASGNIRVGDYILLIDSDSCVPLDCFLDAVSELEQSPEVAILQFPSGVLKVTNTFFENCIAFFSEMTYTLICYATANGDVAPFMGHNAFLRWTAIQEVCEIDDDGCEKFWSDTNISEDLYLSLRLQCSGYIIRLAAWAGDGFKEGVSLTLYDELMRWKKYAYGCNELVFHPIWIWLWRGPFRPVFRRFLVSSVPLSAKVTLLSYIGIYYAIGAAWLTAVINYFIVGWYNGYIDAYYVGSWRVWSSILIVYSGLGNVALAVIRWRTREKGFFYSLYENFKWMFLLALFFGGISLHISQALLASLLNINMSWGATSKEADRSNFFIEVPRILRQFRFSLIFSLCFAVAMPILAVGKFVPLDWQITNFEAIFPVAAVITGHTLFPVLLNPALFKLSS